MGESDMLVWVNPAELAEWFLAHAVLFLCLCLLVALLRRLWRMPEDKAKTKRD